MSNSIYRYPLNPPVSDKGNAGDLESPTEFIDYLAMRRYAINYNDSDSNYYGLNLPGNKVSKIHRNERVYLAIPNQIQTQYQPNYRQVDIGVAGVAAAGLMNSGGNMDQIVETIQGAAAAALPEFASAAIASSASNINQMLGLAGNIDANALQALTKGKVFNPFTEQLFSNMSFRTHSFSFKFFARSGREAQEIFKIINYIKFGSVPIIGGADADEFQTDSSNGDSSENNQDFENLFATDGARRARSARYFEVPDKFELSYRRLNAKGDYDTGGYPLHHRIKDSVCAGIQVNYTPDGSYNSFRHLLSGQPQIMVPSVAVNLTFIETSIITQKDITAGY